MSITKKNTVNGKLRYKNQTYGVLNASLSDQIVKKLESYKGDKQWIDPSAPWKTAELLWTFDEGKLYLSKLYVDGLLEELMGKKRILASWIKKLELLIDDRTVCKTYEQKDSYLKEYSILYLRFSRGIFRNEEKEKILYTTIEPKNNIERHSAYTTLCMDSNNLMVYLEDNMQPGQDQLLPLYATFIEEMLDEYDDISLDMDDLKDVLSRGDDALFLSVKGKNIDKVINSMVSSVTNENILNPKSCLLHITINQTYPRKSIIKIIETIDEGFNFNYEPLKPELKEPFYAGTRFDNNIDDNEVSIMILITI